MLLWFVIKIKMYTYLSTRLSEPTSVGLSIILLSIKDYLFEKFEKKLRYINKKSLIDKEARYKKNRVILIKKSNSLRL